MPVNSATAAGTTTTATTIATTATIIQPTTNIDSLTSNKHFDPHDEDSWFFGLVSRAEASDILLNHNDIGAFLVRESTTARGDLVLSVREGDDKVSHYIINRITSEKGQIRFRIGEQVFLDIPSLLSFYKHNNLDDTPLKVPAVIKQSLHTIYKRSFTNDYLAEIQQKPGEIDRKALPHAIANNIISSSTTTTTALNNNSNNNNNNNNSSSSSSSSSFLNRKLPGLARVVQSKIPNAYDKTALTLKEGEIVRVTKVDVSGRWEGEVSGRKGHFPFNYVKFVEDVEVELQ